MSHNLALSWTEAGHEVTVVTGVPCDSERPVPYRVVRRPSSAQVAALVDAHDIVFANGASMRLFFTAWGKRKPFVWKHATYQLCSLDGFGWTADGPSPLSPLASVSHHLKHSGLWQTARMTTRFGVRSLVSKLVDANIAVSNHQAGRQRLPRSRVIYNPVDFEAFAVGNADQAEALVDDASHTFTYVGRLIAEKGVDDLIAAFGRVAREKTAPCTLKIVGGGPEAGRLKELARAHEVDELVTFVGEKEGGELLAEVRSAGICVLPSAWEEPMGLVTLELMAAGKPLIVSAVGGLSECAGDACLTFPNRDVDSLAAAMRRLAGSAEDRRNLIERALARADRFRAYKSPDLYLMLFAEIISGRAGGGVGSAPAKSNT